MNKLIKTEAVNSSNIKAIGYDPEKRLLQVDFYTGASYQYEPVTQEAFMEFKKAESIGHYFFNNIRNNSLLNCTQVKEKNEIEKNFKGPVR